MTNISQQNYADVQPLQPANCESSHEKVICKHVDNKKCDRRIFRKDPGGKTSPMGLLMRLILVSICVILPLFIVAISLGWIIVPNFIKQQISNKAVISQEVNPELYSAWVHPPVPIYLKVYLFNVTNPEDVRQGNLPKLQELGPYIFLENRTKVEISHDENSDTVRYKEYISFHFQSDLSGKARLDDVVTIINVPFVAAAIKVFHDLPWPFDELAKVVITRFKEPLFVQKTAEEALFKGWKVPFLESIENETGISLIPNNTFAFFIGQNDTTQGPFTISRGTNDKSMFGTILKFKNSTQLDFWGDSQNFCNKIYGTDGTIFPPHVNKSSVLRLFNPELCRSLYLTYNGNSEFEGIKAFRFTAPQTVIQDPRLSEENRCFCSTVETEPDQCLGQGALDLGPCRDQAPVAMSLPHFLYAIPKYIDQSGLTPDKDKHETFMDIEPLTGIVLQASKRIQINLILKPVKGLSSVRKVPEMLFPLVWADECASLDPENAAKFKSIFFTLGLVDFISKWGSTGIAVILSLFCIYLQIRKQHPVLYSSAPSPKLECFLNNKSSRNNNKTNGVKIIETTHRQRSNLNYCENGCAKSLIVEENFNEGVNSPIEKSPWPGVVPLALPEDLDDDLM